MGGRIVKQVIVYTGFPKSLYNIESPDRQGVEFALLESLVTLFCSNSRKNTIKYKFIRKTTFNWPLSDWFFVP